MTKKLKDTLKMVTEDREKAIQEILLEEKSKMNQIREETIRREQQSIESKESEKKTLIETYERTITELKFKNEELSTKNTNLIEFKLNLESSERENRTKLKNYERENMVLQQEHNK